MNLSAHKPLRGAVLNAGHPLDTMSGEVLEVGQVLWRFGSGRRGEMDRLEITGVENAA